MFIRQPPAGVTRTRLMGKGGKRRIDSLMQAARYGRSLTDDQVMSRSDRKLVRISLASFSYAPPFLIMRLAQPDNMTAVVSLPAALFLSPRQSAAYTMEPRVIYQTGRMGGKQASRKASSTHTMSDEFITISSTVDALFASPFFRM